MGLGRVPGLRLRDRFGVAGVSVLLRVFAVVAAGVAAEGDAGEAPLREVLAAALEANEQLSRLVAELAARDAELERARADLAVLQRWRSAGRRRGRGRRRRLLVVAARAGSPGTARAGEAGAGGQGRAA